jgi:hypothetical protein
MQIDFLPHESWSFERESISLYARAGGKMIRCVVTQDFLTAPFALKGNGKEARRLFHARLGQIESLLRRRIEAGEIDSAGEVVLRHGEGP